jgi:hypothetical protein
MTRFLVYYGPGILFLCAIVAVFVGIPVYAAIDMGRERRRPR